MYRPPRPNEAGYGQPRTSEYGAGLRRALAGVIPANQRGTRGREPVPHAGLIRQQPPVLQNLTPFGDKLGVFFARGARPRQVVAIRSYFGALPIAEQPLVKRVDPWSDRTRGAP